MSKASGGSGTGGRGGGPGNGNGGNGGGSQTFNSGSVSATLNGEVSDSAIRSGKTTLQDHTERDSNLSADISKSKVSFRDAYEAERAAKINSSQASENSLATKPAVVKGTVEGAIHRMEKDVIIRTKGKAITAKYKGKDAVTRQNINVGDKIVYHSDYGAIRSDR